MGAHALAEALRLQKCVKAYISLAWFAPGIKADKILMWSAICEERCSEYNQARSPRRLVVIASPFYEKQEKDNFHFNKNHQYFFSL